MKARIERFQPDRDPRVELRLSRADVHVVASDDDTITVELAGRDPNEVRVELVGATVRVREEGARFRSAVSSVTVHVPAGCHLDVDLASGDTTVDVAVRDARLRTATGEITATELMGRCEVRSASGDVRLDAVEHLSLTCASGDLRVGHVRGSADINSASGDVDLDHVEGDTTIKTASGNVVIAHLAARRCDVKTASGDTSVGVAPGRRVSYDFKSMSGTATTRAPDQVPAADAPRDPTQVVVRSLSGDLDLHAATPRA